ncbi:MAG: ATP-dependent helicase HrpB [Caulobacterales bacterium]|nr:ATP-dependent helicase HrpB [Caulobacterales bacterium]
MLSGLPIFDAVPALLSALANGNRAILVAPPGAGKTTVVPLAIKDEAWLAGGRIIMLEPRRLAARAAARRMAQMLGEPVGETVGYRVRMESRVSARTRIEVVTEGVFTRMILNDPGLEGVGAVLFDEFHERSLDADLGLALTVEAQNLLRPDLRLVVMSATLDGASVSARLDAPVIESLGRTFPVGTHYLGRPDRLEDGVVRAVQAALAGETGSILVFLPGQGEIRRVEAMLAERIRDPSVIVAPLYGALDFKAQDLAISAPPPNRRKVVLATSIAQTSLTIDGVSVVIDSGLARVPRFDPGSGLTRLKTERVSRASADQRRGRAGRTGPGACYRLWDEEATRGLAAFDRPEILEADLSGLVLDLARWGARTTDGLLFLDPPPKGAWDQAVNQLKGIRALDPQGRLTSHGEAIGGLPLPAALAHMLVRAGERGQAETAGQIAVLLTERGLGGHEVDLAHRLQRLQRDGSPRAREAMSLAGRWARLAGAGKPASKAPDDAGLLLAEAFPDRIAKARGKPGEFVLASGRGVFLEPTEALARQTWLAVGELGGGVDRDRVLLAAGLDEEDVKVRFGDALTVEDRLDLEAPGGATALRVTRLGAIVVEERRIDRPDPQLIEAALMAEVRRKGLGILPIGEATQGLRARIAFLAATDDAWPDLSDTVLMGGLEQWLGPVLSGRRRLADLGDNELMASIRSQIPWDMMRRLDAEAPERFEAPTGSRLKIDYAAEAGPTVSVRVQELFGLSHHPTVGPGRTPLVFELLSPAHRPIQLTRDLPGFWKGSWSAVRSEMRGRYPKHVWPEDPASAAATTRAKPKGT